MKNNASEYIASEFIDYFQELNIVSGIDLCLGQNTVSLSVCPSKYIGELIKINSQKILIAFFKSLKLYIEHAFF